MFVSQTSEVLTFPTLKKSVMEEHTKTQFSSDTSI